MAPVENTAKGGAAGFDDRTRRRSRVNSRLGSATPPMNEKANRGHTWNLKRSHDLRDANLKPQSSHLIRSLFVDQCSVNIVVRADGLQQYRVATFVRLPRERASIFPPTGGAILPRASKPPSLASPPFISMSSSSPLLIGGSSARFPTFFRPANSASCHFIFLNSSSAILPVFATRNRRGDDKFFGPARACRKSRSAYPAA